MYIYVYIYMYIYMYIHKLTTMAPETIPHVKQNISRRVGVA